MGHDVVSQERLKREAEADAEKMKKAIVRRIPLPKVRSVAGTQAVALYMVERDATLHTRVQHCRVHLPNAVVFLWYRGSTSTRWTPHQCGCGAGIPQDLLQPLSLVGQMTCSPCP